MLSTKQKLFDFIEAKEIQPLVFCANKPLGISSFMIVDLFKKILHSKVGHAGTLDPLATGSLILLLNKATKKVSLFLEDDKIYEFTILVGANTKSFDLETPLNDFKNIDSILSNDQLELLRQSVLGKHDFPVGVYSALKSAGKPMYKDKTQDHIKLKTMNIKEIQVLEQRLISSKDLIKALQRKIQTIERNYRFIQEDLEYYLGFKHETLYKNLLNSLHENLKILDKFTINRFLEIKINTVVSKGTYVRTMVSEISKALQMPMTTFDIKRLCKYN